jgi:hypothetical protein
MIKFLQWRGRAFRFKSSHALGRDAGFPLQSLTHDLIRQPKRLTPSPTGEGKYNI